MAISYNQYLSLIKSIKQVTGKHFVFRFSVFIQMKGIFFADVKKEDISFTERGLNIFRGI